MYVSMFMELLRDVSSYANLFRGLPSLGDVIRKIDLEGSFHIYFFITLVFVLSVMYMIQKAHRNFPPGPISWPVVGNLDFFRSKAHIRLSNLKEKYGDVYSMKVGQYDFVVICSLEGMLEGMGYSGDVCSGRPALPMFSCMLKGEKQRGIVMADMDMKVNVKRNFILESLDTQCSSPRVLEQDIQQETLSLMCYFLQETGPFDPSECFKFAHLHIMMLLVFNEKFDPEDLILDRIFEAFEERHASLKVKLHHFYPALKSFYREDMKKLLLFSDILTKYEKMLLNQHKDTYNPDRLRDLVDHMLLFIETNEDRELLTADDMDDLLLELSGTGFVTVPALLSWLLGYMAAFPAIQRKLQEELDSIVGRERFPSLEDEPFLPFTVAVILEVQRIVTITPFLLPHRAIRNTVFQGYDIPKDTILLFNVWSLHHDQRYWKNPMKFSPERFLDDQGALCIPDHFMPFGLGSRRCPGESLVEVEVFLIFTCIMHQLTVSASPEASELNLEAEFNFVLTPKKLKLKITEREN